MPDLRLISLDYGIQTYVFYSIKPQSLISNAIGMIEILINGQDTQPLILDQGELNDPNTNDKNYGPINLGGTPSNYLVAIFSKFNTAYALTMCSHRQVISSKSPTHCDYLPEN